MKIPEFKRSGIVLILEFRRIPNGFPNLEAFVPIDWIQMHPKFAPSSFLGENILLEITDGHCRFSRLIPRKIDRANGIP
jgi:hypothetical protein